MHRFVWDLHYPDPDVLDRDFPISAIFHDTPLHPQGATVLPGKYTIKFRAEGKTYTQALDIGMDPRVKTSPEDLRRQFDLDRKIAGDLHRDYQAIQQARNLRAQLKSITAAKPNSEIARAASDLETKGEKLEGTAGGYGTLYLSTPEGRSLSRLNAGFNAVVSALDTADAAPTTQETAVVADLEKALDEQLSAWDAIKTKDVTELNNRLKQSGLPEIDLNKTVAGESPQTGSQDRD